MLKKGLKILIIGFIGVILITPYLSKAQPEELKSALGEVLERSANTNIKGNNIEAKKNILLKILSLSILEIAELKNNLEELGNLESDYLKTRDQFLTKLDSYLDYYELLKNQLSANLDLEQIKTFSSDFKTWRELNYNLEAKKIINFVLVFQNEKFLKIAEKRLENILKDFQKIKTSNIKTEALRLLKGAQADLKEAGKLNISAKKLLLPIEEIINLLTTTSTITSTESSTTSTTIPTMTSTEILIRPSSETSTETMASTTETSVATSTATSTEITLKQELDIQKLVEGALAKIQNAYLKFFRVSALIKKLR